MPAQAPPALPAAGAVPAAFAAVLAADWEPQMPPALRCSRFLGVVHAAHRLSDPLGLLRTTPGRPVPVAAVARLAATSPDDTAAYLRAAKAAGILTERHRCWALAPAAVPDWSAALDVVEGHRATAGSAA